MGFFLFVLFLPNLIFFEFLTKSAKNVIFLKNIKFWALFVNNSENLRPGGGKKCVPRAKYSLHDKRSNFDFKWLLFELFSLKNCKNPSKLNGKKLPI